MPSDNRVFLVSQLLQKQTQDPTRGPQIKTHSFRLNEPRDVSAHLPLFPREPRDTGSLRKRQQGSQDPVGGDPKAGCKHTGDAAGKGRAARGQHGAQHPRVLAGKLRGSEDSTKPAGHYPLQ